MEAGQAEQLGTVLARISNRIVGLHKEYYGRGPTMAKTYFQDDLVVVLMRGGFTKVEQTLRVSRGILVTPLSEVSRSRRASR